MMLTATFLGARIFRTFMVYWNQDPLAMKLSITYLFNRANYVQNRSLINSSLRNFEK